MRCPFCSSENLKVLESRSADDNKSIRRRRECIDCEQRFTTYERHEFSQMVVIKNSGDKAIYSRDKLTGSIIRACSKTQLSTIMIDSIVDTVEAKMYKDFQREVSSAVIGQMVLDELLKADPLAYIRYASIFKRFTSVHEFLEEVKAVERDVVSSVYTEQNFVLN